MNINHIQIYDYELNLSKRINEVVSQLPSEWICLTDNDTLKFPSFSRNLKEVLEGDITEMDLIGTMTNRLRPINPAVINELYDESNIDVHFKAAEEIWKDNGTELMEVDLVAGCCMVFHKSLWEKVGGFDESKLFFDKYFSYNVKEIGGRCLIAKGIYIFHLYRWGSISPVNSVEHLIKNN